MSWRWQAPPAAGCPDSDQLQAEIARLSERDLADEEGELQIEALALMHDGNWVASVALRDAQGRVLGGREVSGPYLLCSELQLPVALVVATLLDELAQQPAPVAPTPVAEPAAPAAQTSVSKRRLGLAAFLTGALGLLPRLTLGAGVGLELPLAWPLAISASVYLPGHELDEQERGARFTSFHGGAASCPRLAGGRHVLRLCGTAQLGAVVGQGVGLNDAQRAARPMVLLGLEPQLVFGLSPRWALLASLGAHWLPVRPGFHWQIEGSPPASTQTEAYALMARIGFIDFLR